VFLDIGFFLVFHVDYSTRILVIGFSHFRVLDIGFFLVFHVDYSTRILVSCGCYLNDIGFSWFSL
jgi:hypothetical protein